MQNPSAPKRKDSPSRSFFDRTRNRIAMLAVLSTSLLPTCKTSNPKSPDNGAWTNEDWDEDEWGDEWGKDEWGDASGGWDESWDKEEMVQGEKEEVVGNEDKTALSLNLDQARQYAIVLVNRDRLKHGLNPVVHDDIATNAGQRHAEDMGANGFTAHWGTDGSVPEQRYTEAGGEDYVAENAGCIAGGGQKYQIDPKQVFSKALVEYRHIRLMNSPGHRKTILTPGYNRLGIGLVYLPKYKVACIAQEFVGDYGTYGKLPAQAAVGQQITVSGQVTAPYSVGGVGISRIDTAAPMSYAQLAKTHSYPVPSTYVDFFPQGFVSPKPVNLQGNQFTIDVTLDDQKRPGRYGIAVWGKLPGQSKMGMISLRTIDVR